MLGMAKLLWNDGGRLGAFSVVLFAVVVPAMKLVALIAADILRRGSPTVRRLTWARWCLQTVQIVSKWASPDMFAYIFLLYLMRMLNKPPFLGGEAVLDKGSTCFVLFCVFSTVATLGIELPANPKTLLG